MKKIILALAIALMGTMVMNAQPPRRTDMSPEQMVERRVERLDKALSLTPEQKTAIAKIYTEEMQTMGKERIAKKEHAEKPDEATMKAKREQMKAQRDATRAKIESLLTPEQAAKYAELQKREGKRGHHGPRHGGHDKAPKKGGNSDGCDNACKKDR